VSLDAPVEEADYYTHDTAPVHDEIETAPQTDNNEYGKCTTVWLVKVALPYIETWLHTVTALYDFEAQSAEELSLKEGDRIILLSRDEGGWWHGKL
jgi:hypothetical protein